MYSPILLIHAEESSLETDSMHLYIVTSECIRTKKYKGNKDSVWQGHLNKRA